MKEKPNIVFILIDDMGWRDLTSYGSTFYETPNVDKLLNEGIHFTDAYTASPVCSPTRASILTGKYPAHLGLTNFIGGYSEGKLMDAPYVDHLSLSEVSLAKTLKQHGYETWHAGKWHLGNKKYYPEKHGFDVNIGGCRWGCPMNGYFSPWGIETLKDEQEGEYLTDRLTDEAIELIKKNNGRKPFFLNMWYYSVHIPIQAREIYIKKYRTKVQELGLDKKQTFEIGEFFPSNGFSPKIFRLLRRLIQSDPEYAAMIEMLDNNIGRLIKAIRKYTKINKTLIIFTSDNGGLSTAEGSPTTNRPLSEGKGWMYEGGVRVPLIIKYPGLIKPGSICDFPVTSPDFYPTILEIVGLEKKNKQQFDGVSLLPLLKGEKNLNRDAIYWHYPHYGNQGGTPGSSIRMNNYKLIEFYEDGRLELYDLRKDISEEKNLIRVYPEIADKMHKKLISWRKNLGAIAPKNNKNWISL